MSRRSVLTAIDLDRSPYNGLLIILMIAINLIFAHTGVAQDLSARARSDKIMAAVIFQITKFITLPPSQSRTSSSNELTFCVMGETKLSADVTKLASNKEVGGRRVKVLSLESDKLCSKLSNSCNIVFVDQTLPENSSCLERSLKIRVPLICRVDRVAWNGCMAEVFAEKNRARIAIDLKRTKQLGIEVSSDLLGLAIVNR